ncbi:hypothetical protein P7F88_08370 [Vibrio hannami]|uniref:hypothetical protein n=1 Tax=Vibrio hannami TaxID=2717094 RepID=UPI00240EFCF4|nr:hypothetical protein [Vibrio hannami]MDG3086111.1 hypothetical protein [Vibrio hannami]
MMPENDKSLVENSIELLIDIELELRFHKPDSSDSLYIRDLVMWLKTGLPASRFFYTKDGQSLAEVARFVVDSSYIPDEAMVQNAIDATGFSIEGTGVSYPPNWSEEQLKESGINEPDSMVVVSYWVGGFSEVLMPESIYLSALKQYLYEKENLELVKILLQSREFDVKADTVSEQLNAVYRYLPELQVEMRYLLNSDKKHIAERLSDLQVSLSRLNLPADRKFGHIGSFELW